MKLEFDKITWKAKGRDDIIWIRSENRYYTYKDNVIVDFEDNTMKVGSLNIEDVNSIKELPEETVFEELYKVAKKQKEEHSNPVYAELICNLNIYDEISPRTVRCRVCYNYTNSEYMIVDDNGGVICQEFRPIG